MVPVYDRISAKSVHSRPAAPCMLGNSLSGQGSQEDKRLKGSRVFFCKKRSATKVYMAGKAVTGLRAATLDLSSTWITVQPVARYEPFGPYRLSTSWFPSGAMELAPIVRRFYGDYNGP